ncbi:MAG: hypothetical protein NXY57DRAFT_622929 [Lentinula lateritia]|uniref:Uncharacterized protein n=1 Tax=Lentinula lateritia TaxID=40482 RepID=A0ABQ8VIK6_9AGAR|nr:MAG: hypothetical protein NXY57DRAFT_622929 [Lentinula lateritia]KAJ4489152.1 hypothetical protein C8R41DRAFT_387129 [Lentinula lateritia]
MSNDKLNGTSTIINNNAQNVSGQLSSMHPDISHIVSVLTETHMDSNADDNKDMSESDLAALFKQIDGANGVLNGVEDKLDGILSNLDTLLAVLEDAGDQSSGEGEAERAASQNEGKESAGDKE